MNQSMPSTLHRSLPRPLPLLPPPLSLAQDRQERLLQELLEIKRKKREAKAQLVRFFFVLFLFSSCFLYFFCLLPHSLPLFTQFATGVFACCMRAAPHSGPLPLVRTHNLSRARAHAHTRSMRHVRTPYCLLFLFLYARSHDMYCLSCSTLSLSHTHTHTHTHTSTTHKHTQGQKELDAEKA